MDFAGGSILALFLATFLCCRRFKCGACLRKSVRSYVEKTNKIENVKVVAVKKKKLMWADKTSKGL